MLRIQGLLVWHAQGLLLEECARVELSSGAHWPVIFVGYGLSDLLMRKLCMTVHQQVIHVLNAAIKGACSERILPCVCDEPAKTEGRRYTFRLVGLQIAELGLSAVCPC